MTEVSYHVRYHVLPYFDDAGLSRFDVQRVTEATVTNARGHRMWQAGHNRTTQETVLEGLTTAELATLGNQVMRALAHEATSLDRDRRKALIHVLNEEESA